MFFNRKKNATATPTAVIIPMPTPEDLKATAILKEMQAILNINQGILDQLPEALSKIDIRGNGYTTLTAIFDGTTATDNTRIGIDNLDHRQVEMLYNMPYLDGSLPEHKTLDRKRVFAEDEINVWFRPVKSRLEAARWRLLKVEFNCGYIEDSGSFISYALKVDPII